MTKRSFLTSIVLVLICLGLVVASIPFTQSLMPTSKAGESAFKINISDLELGQFLIHKHPGSTLSGLKYLILRDLDSEIYVYKVRYTEQGIVMPDTSWWYTMAGYCKDFGPEVEGMIIKPRGVIKCHDHDVLEFWKKNWLWKYSGESLGEYPEDMISPIFHIEGNRLIIVSRYL